MDVVVFTHRGNFDCKYSGEMSDLYMEMNDESVEFVGFQSKPKEFMLVRKADIISVKARSEDDE